MAKFGRCELFFDCVKVGKEMLCLGHQAKGDSEGPGFPFLMELLRGDY
jgi:hypothetical protein